MSLLAEIDVAEKGYSKSLFVGYKQALGMGWKIRKGSKATYLRWVGAVPKKDEDGEETGEVIRLPRWVPVFNLDCVDDKNSEVKVQDLAAKFDRPENSAPRIEAAEALISAQSATVVSGGNRASYNSSDDFIRMPRYKEFSSAEAYYAVHIHELIHWAAHPSRLNRPIFNRFGTQAYAFEELVAELGAVFVCSHLGITPCLENHASYLGEWQSIITSDNRAFFRAATLARDAANYLLENAGMLTRNLSDLEPTDQAELVAV